MIQYLLEVQRLAERLMGQRDQLEAAAERAAQTIAGGHWVRVFGSGHSVLPVQDTFPRYGGYVGFYPVMDPRLMWTTVSGPGGAEEVLWLERREGYMEVFLRHERWDPQDMLVVISHGGQNAAPVEVALEGRRRGMFVVAVTSGENHRTKPATHSSGLKIGDIADIVIDNGVTSEDAVVEVPGVAGKVGGLSTLASIAVMQTLVSETALRLAERGYAVKPFASPNAEGVEPDRNEQVYVQFRDRVARTTAAALNADRR
ncbi:sugar isomerase domain-containing protein [Alicyclobacillus sp.]|uniref:sugar isomerase domain-containing protein n=1 Tax=Alicyclobacillus sp. TaxID=61169 RepID=UPI0025C280EA|nr:sugar isomerase domain-containing protein [Alicyclobacillus sp.]MCL6516047.1 sugar isomerase domain-containing protein [Alicyclobacillus sp.]